MIYKCRVQVCKMELPVSTPAGVRLRSMVANIQASANNCAHCPFDAMSTKGVLKSMFAEKGFGFVTPDDGGDDCFVHVKDNPELDGVDSGGDAVTFDKEWDDRKGKYKGVNCRVTGGGGGGGKGKGKGKGKDDRYSAW